MMNPIALPENSPPPTAWASSPAPTTPKPDFSQPPFTFSLGESSNTDRPAPEQSAAIAHMESGKNVFLTGMAGTGKSTALVRFVENTRRSVAITATTGIAAINVQAQFLDRCGLSVSAYTIYRWAGIGLGPGYGQSDAAFMAYLKDPRNLTKAREAAFARVRECETLVIDEISMMPGRVLDYLDYHFRILRDAPHLPFGGIQLIVVGDFLQLPPVAKTGRYDWAFASRAWQRAGFNAVSLSTIHRQDEPDFIEALNNFRLGRVSRRVADILSARVKMFVPPAAVRLMTHNAQVDRWNAYSLGSIDAQEITARASFAGSVSEMEFLKKNVTTPETLTLKHGARVMVTANTYENGACIAVNGQCGTLCALAPDGATVRLDGQSHETFIPPYTWLVDPQSKTSGSMTQLPLRLAYAVTIHKSQGLSLDRAHIDLRAAREPGQAYVALSRLRTLAGLTLKEWATTLSISDAALKFHETL